MRHVVMFSGGVGSWMAAKRVAERYGTDGLVLLFADTLIEDPDLYRFLREAAFNVFGGTRPRRTESETCRRHINRVRAWRGRAKRARFVRIADGRTPWQVFRDERFLGNSRVGLCSKILKQQQVDAWLDANCDPADTIVHVGIDWTEEHRLERLRARRGAQGWDYRAPLCEAPYLDKQMMLDALAAEGIRPPRLYTLGFAHNNCGGGCVRAGIGHFTHLYRTLPKVYAEWEANEQALREFLARDDIAILRDRTGGTAKPLTLVQLRRRLDAGHTPDLFEIGGCGCFIDLDLSVPAELLKADGSANRASIEAGARAFDAAFKAAG